MPRVCVHVIDDFLFVGPSDSSFCLTIKRKVSILYNKELVINMFFNFACAVVKTGRAFLRRLIDLIIGLRSPSHRRRLAKGGRIDVSAWPLFIESFNGKSLITTNIWETSEQIGIFTDAINIGFGTIVW